MAGRGQNQSPEEPSQQNIFPTFMTMLKHVDISEHQSVCRGWSLLWFPSFFFFFFFSSFSFLLALMVLAPSVVQILLSLGRIQRQKGKSPRWIPGTAWSKTNCREQSNEHFLAAKKYLKPSHHLYGGFPSLIHALISGGCGQTPPLAVAEPAAEMSAACLGARNCTPARDCCLSFTFFRAAPRNCSFLLSSFTLSCFISL